MLFNGNTKTWLSYMYYITEEAISILKWFRKVVHICDDKNHLSRERDWERDRDRQRERDRQTDRQRERGRERDRETDRETDILFDVY